MSDGRHRLMARLRRKNRSPCYLQIDASGNWGPRREATRNIVVGRAQSRDRNARHRTFSTTGISPLVPPEGPEPRRAQLGVPRGVRDVRVVEIHLDRPQALKEILGHSSLAMTMRYAHLAPEHLRSEVTKTERPATQTTPQPENLAQEIAQEATTTRSGLDR
jgi:hypothetical protein